MDPNQSTIRAEMQSLRSIGFQLCQTGIALCVGVEIALTFVRRHTAERLFQDNAAVGNLPWSRFLLGTIFLVVIATIFSGLVLFLRKRYAFYNDLARQSAGGIPVPPSSNLAGLGTVAVFFAFPLADFLFRALYATFAGGH